MRCFSAKPSFNRNFLHFCGFHSIDAGHHRCLHDMIGTFSREHSLIKALHLEGNAMGKKLRAIDGFRLLVVLMMLMGGNLVAEDDCAGPTYVNPSCSNECPLEDCQDISFAQDATLFQCCPPADKVPELPNGMGPLTLVFIFLGLSAGLWYWRRRKGIVG